MRAAILVLIAAILIAGAALLLIPQPRSTASTYSLALGDLHFEKGVRIGEERTDTLLFSSPEPPLGYMVLFLVPKPLAESASSLQLETESSSVLIEDPVVVLEDADGDGKITATATFETTSDAASTLALAVPAGFIESMKPVQLEQLKEKLAELMEKQPTQREAQLVEQGFNSAVIKARLEFSDVSSNEEILFAGMPLLAFDFVINQLDVASNRIDAEREGGRYAITFSPQTIVYPVQVTGRVGIVTLEEPAKIAVVTTRNITASIKLFDARGTGLEVLAENQKIKANTKENPRVFQWDGKINGKDLQDGTYSAMLIDTAGMVLASTIFEVAKKVPLYTHRDILRERYPWSMVAGLSLSDAQHSDSTTLRIVNPMKIELAGVDGEAQSIPAPTLKGIDNFKRSAENPALFTHSTIPGLTLRAELEGNEEPYRLKIEVSATDVSKVPDRVHGRIVLDYEIWWGGKFGIPLDVVKNCDDSVNVCYAESICSNGLCDRSAALYKITYSPLNLTQIHTLYECHFSSFPVSKSLTEHQMHKTVTYPDLTSCIEEADKRNGCYPGKELRMSLRAYDSVFGVLGYTPHSVRYEGDCELLNTKRQEEPEEPVPWTLCLPPEPGKEFYCVQPAEQTCEHTHSEHYKQERCEDLRDTLNKLIEESATYPQQVSVCRDGDFTYCSNLYRGCPKGELWFVAQKSDHCLKWSNKLTEGEYYLEKDRWNGLFSCARKIDFFLELTIGGDYYISGNSELRRTYTPFVISTHADEESCRAEDKARNATRTGFPWLLCRHVKSATHYCTQYGTDCEIYLKTPEPLNPFSSDNYKECWEEAGEYNEKSYYLCSARSGSEPLICTNALTECKEWFRVYSSKTAEADCEKELLEITRMREKAKGTRIKFVFVEEYGVSNAKKTTYIMQQHFRHFNELAGTLGETELVVITEDPWENGVSVHMRGSRSKLTQGLVGWIKERVADFDENRDRIVVLFGLDPGFRKNFFASTLIAYSSKFLPETTAHEISHTYGYCDEYDYKRWGHQNEWSIEMGMGGCINPHPICCIDSPNYDGISRNCAPTGDTPEILNPKLCWGSESCSPKYLKQCRSVMGGYSSKDVPLLERFLPKAGLLRERIEAGIQPVFLWE